MSEFIVNEVDLARVVEARQAMLGGGAMDMKRPDAWRQYGYPDQIEFAQLYRAYTRGGPGHGAVHRLLDGCWQQLPRIRNPASEDETSWEVETRTVLEGAKAWAKLRELDRRNLIGNYAALIYRMRDGLKPLDTPLAQAEVIMDLVPVYQDGIDVEWYTDPSDHENFGKPKMFTLRPDSFGGGDKNAPPAEWLRVHPSRVQVLAEGSVGYRFTDGVPLLEAGYNAIVDMEKVRGGGGEGFLKNAARNLVFKFAPDAALETIGPNGERTSAKAAIEAQVQRLNRNIDGAAVTQGGDVQALQTNMPDPSKPWEVAACEFAAAVRIPFTILFGQQTGRLASDEDKADFQARCKSRQQNELTPMLTEFIKRMQACGAIKPGEFIVEWPDLSAPSDKEKLEHAEKMANINASVARTPGMSEAPFDADEIRQAAGYTGRAAVELGEGGDPPADPAEKVPQ